MLKKAQHMLGLARCAIDKYNMIDNGDNIAVGVSGGKDSLALLCLLSEMRRFYPKSFSLTALTIDPCFDEPMDCSEIATLCRSLNIKYVFRKEPFGDILFKYRDEKKPCSLCARLRRGCLHNMAIEQGCNKLALGHHQDDAAQTLLMNILNGATVSCFAPVSYMSRKNIHVIRPLIFATESEVTAFVKANALPIVKSSCPVDGTTERERIKKLIESLSKEYGALNQKLTMALQKACINGW